MAYLQWAAFEAVLVEEWERMIDINIKGVRYGSCLGWMAEADDPSCDRVRPTLQNRQAVQDGNSWETVAVGTFTNRSGVSSGQAQRDTGAGGSRGRSGYTSR